MSEGTDDHDADPAEPSGEIDTSHLDGVQDGCGCTEIWEHLSESREAAVAETTD